MNESDGVNGHSAETSNVIPEAELARRRAVLEATETIADNLSEIVASAKVLRDANVPTSDWMTVVVSYFPEGAQRAWMEHAGIASAAIDGLLDFVDGNPKNVVNAVVDSFLKGLDAGSRDAARAALGSLPAEAPQRTPEEVLAAMHATPAEARMKKVITRLFQEAPKMPDGEKSKDQSPAMEVLVCLRGAIPPQRGALSTTPEGSLRLLSMEKADNNRTVLVEQFFDYSDVVSVALIREVKATSESRIVTS